MAESDSPIDVSVITATRNRPRAWVERALQSVAAQTGVTLEAIVVDDGSSADTLTVLRELVAQHGPRFRLLEPICPDVPGTGPSAARNRGLAHAGGTFVAFLDDDDHWLVPDHLHQAVRWMRAQAADLYFTNMRGENQDRVTIPDWFPDSPWLTRHPPVDAEVPVHPVSLPDLAHTMRHHYPHPNGCVFRRTLLQQVGPFWERLGIAEDFDLILRVADRARGILYRAQAVVGYNVTPRSSAFTRANPVERSLQCVLAAQHVRAHAQHACVRACARRVEAWHLRAIADILTREGRRPAARSFLLQALAAHPSAGNLARLLRAIIR